MPREYGHYEIQMACTYHFPQHAVALAEAGVIRPEPFVNLGNCHGPVVLRKGDCSQVAVRYGGSDFVCLKGGSHNCTSHAKPTNCVYTVTPPGISTRVHATTREILRQADADLRVLSWVDNNTYLDRIYASTPLRVGKQ